MKIVTIIIFLSISLIAQTQIFIEHFNFSSGSLITVSSDWTTHSGSTPGEVNVLDTPSDTSGSLRYNDNYNWYFNSSAGNRVELTQSESEDVGRSFSQTYSLGIIYTSFLLKVISEPSGTGTYFIHYFQGVLGTGTSFGASVFIRSQLASTFQLGINTRTTIANTVWYTTNLNLNQTYLIVVSYEFIGGGGNDVASLWVNPFPLESNNIPAATVTHTNTGGTDLTNVGRLGLRQSLASGNGMGTLQIDEIRISDSWNLAPLPVELAFFSITILKEGVNLNWRTETEVNNYGFEIQKSADRIKKSEWSTIGFVQGYGNSNSPKQYSFVDENISTGKYSYRLKQVDTDGQFKYSKVIEVNLDSPSKIELGQNYPNPYNPTTTINFTLPEAGNVKLSVYNIIGEQVAELINGYREAGVYSINFNAYELSFGGQRLNSGVYFYRLSTDNFTDIKKMILMK